MKAAFLLMASAAIAANVYVFWRIWTTVPGGIAAKCCVCALYALWEASFFLARRHLGSLPVRAATPLYEISNTWIIAFLYILLAFLVLDIAGLIYPSAKGLLHNSLAGTVFVTCTVALVLFCGNRHYHHKYREEMTMEATVAGSAAPAASGAAGVRIVLASDLHLGYHNRRDELARWIDLINAENPDLVLFGGDIIDISVKPLIEGNYAEEFHRLKAPVFAVLGNHEFYSGNERAEQFYRDAGITLLRDSVAFVDGIAIIGRDDRTNADRLPLSEILARYGIGTEELAAEGPDGAKPFTILLDHQPTNLEDAERCGIDFQFSGHTHRGQVWPVSWVTDAIFEKSWGQHRRGNTRYYVSSGLGIWGAKVRIGTRSEYLVLKLQR